MVDVSIPGLPGVFPGVQVVAAMRGHQVRADRDDDHRHINSAEGGADGYQDDAIALAEKRAGESRPQRLGLVLRNEAIQPERQQPGQRTDQRRHSPPRIAQLRRDQSREDRRIGVRAAEVVEERPKRRLEISPPGRPFRRPRRRVR